MWLIGPKFITRDSSRTLHIREKMQTELPASWVPYLCARYVS